MRSYLHLAIFTVVGPSIAHAAVSIWVARRVPGMKSRRARLALAVELVVLGVLVPVAGRLGEILPFPWNAIVGATEVWNFALVCVAPALAGLELVMFVLWFAARRKARSRTFAGGQSLAAASDATSARAVDEAALAAHAALSRREAFAQIAGISAVVGTAGPILWGGLRTRVDVETTEIVVKIARLPKVLDGFSIVQISDVHVGPFVAAGPHRDDGRSRATPARLCADGRRLARAFARKIKTWSRDDSRQSRVLRRRRRGARRGPARGVRRVV